MPFLGIKRFVANLTLYSCSVLTSPFHREGKQCVFFLSIPSQGFLMAKTQSSAVKKRQLYLFGPVRCTGARGCCWSGVREKHCWLAGGLRLLLE